MKILMLLLVLSLTLVSCTPSTQSKTDIVLPSGLKDCKMFKLRDSWGDTIYVMRCPNSSVSTLSGAETPNRSIAVDG